MEEPRVRGGSFRMETELRFASSPRRLSLRLRVRTAGFFLPSASFRPLSAALSRDVCVCVCVPVGGGANLCLVWQRRFRRHDDEPRKPSRTLTPPLALSRFSFHPLSRLSPSRVCIYHYPLLSTSTILWPVHRNILFPIRFSVSLPFYSAATPIPAARLWLLRALSCTRVRASIHLSRARRVYVCMRDSADCRPVHPPPRFCPWLLHPAVPVCEGGGPRSYATRDPRAGSSPRTTETRRRRMRKRTRATSSTRKLEVQR